MTEKTTDPAADPTPDPTPAASDPAESGRKRYLCRHIHTSGRRGRSRPTTYSRFRYAFAASSSGNSRSSA